MLQISRIILRSSAKSLFDSKSNVSLCFFIRKNYLKCLSSIVELNLQRKLIKNSKRIFLISNEFSKLFLQKLNIELKINSLSIVQLFEHSSRANSPACAILIDNFLWLGGCLNWLITITSLKILTRIVKYNSNYSISIN